MNAIDNRVKAVFLEALEIGPPERWDDFLRGACGDDEDLLRRVKVLLDAQRGADSLLDGPGLVPTVAKESATAEAVGTVIGPYTLREQIGEGGMGVVYVAEQSHPVRRKVALKVIKPGMDTKQVVARFEAERQALAMMDHPNIAKVHDGGTTESGRPYFVMELVPGMPISEFCDGDRLSVRQRLELFVLVCRAVQHAHQKGIIHRDLKPSNILVTLHDGVPVPKVIDFGVAKAMGQSLTEKTVYTALSQLVGTPLYMSPEQAEMNQLGVDTRSDVYSLGVLLYELLTGTTPFDKEALGGSGLEEMRRMIREDEPPRPSARVSSLQPEALSTTSQRRSTDPRRISAALHGELDWIVMKALEKDRGRRYESAGAFATDIQRYLDDEPVLAGPPSTMYKFHKFARKHRAALATAVAIAASLILGTTASAWQAVRATTAEAQANANEQKAVANAATAQEKEREAVKQRDEVKALAEKLAAREQQLQRTLYAAHMNLAQHAWEGGAIGRVNELLEQHRPKPGETDLRGFEWYYLFRLCHAELLTMKVDARSGIQVVAYSPDGKRLASASGSRDNATVKVWDAQTGKELLSFKGGSHRYGDFRKCLAFSPDGKRLAGSSGLTGALRKEARGEVKVWDAQTGKELLSLPAKDMSLSVAFSPDGKRLASAGWAVEPTGNNVGDAKIWDAETGRELLTLKGARGGVAFSPDGKRLASGTKVWDAQTGQELLSLKGHTGGSVTSVAYSPDGTRTATASFNDKTVKVWDALTGQELLTLKGCDGYSVVFSPDGKHLAATSETKVVTVWDTQTGQELLSLKGHEYVLDVAFSPDGKRLVSGGGDEVKVWDVQTEPRPLTLRGSDGYVIASVAFSPDGKRLASGSFRGPPYTAPKRGEAKVWDVQTGRALFSLKRGNGAVVFSPDGKRLATWNGIRSYDPTRVPQELNVWDAQTGQELLSLKRRDNQRFSVPAFSPDGKRLASGSKVWDAQTGEELLTLQGGGGGRLFFSPDGKRLAGYINNSQPDGARVKVWDSQTGQELLSLKGGAGSVAFSPDGKRLASGSQVWDAETGRELLSFKGHASWVENVAFSPDGKRLATASYDKTVKVWDAETGQELLTVPGAVGLAFSPDGHRLASGTEGGTVTIYDATPLPEKP